jgi:hypothetical protein
VPPTSTPILPTDTPIPPPPTITATPDSAFRVPHSDFGPLVSLDVVVYFTNPWATVSQERGPDPGSAIPGVQVQVIDLYTNRPLPGLETTTDAYGHARLTWAWQGPVQLAVPQLMQTQQNAARDLGLDDTGRRVTAGTGRLYVPIRILPYTAPIINP